MNCLSHFDDSNKILHEFGGKINSIHNFDTVICKAEESRVKECSSPLGLGKICSTEIPEFSENDNFNKMSLYGHFKIYPTK